MGYEALLYVCYHCQISSVPISFWHNFFFLYNFYNGWFLRLHSPQREVKAGNISDVMTVIITINYFKCTYINCDPIFNFTTTCQNQCKKIYIYIQKVKI